MQLVAGILLIGLMLSVFREKAIFLWLVPFSFTVWMVAFVFSYLPHHVHARVPGQDPLDAYQSTCNRVGWEWLLTPLLQGHNYHLVHHLYPTVPFYRLERVWYARHTRHEAHQPAEVSAFSNRPTRRLAS